MKFKKELQTKLATVKDKEQDEAISRSLRTYMAVMEKDMAARWAKEKANMDIREGRSVRRKLDVEK